MPFLDSKVYYDGSHYIAIPHTMRITHRHYHPPPPKVAIGQSVEQDVNEVSKPEIVEPVTVEDDIFGTMTVVENETKVVTPEPTNTPPPTTVRVQKTYRELFNETYRACLDLPRKERKSSIFKEIRPYFKNDMQCHNFIKINLERKRRNLIVRRTRMLRKAALVDFNYFCTFTYDDAKHDEDSFKKKLKACFRNLCYRRDWKYMGVWERAPETKRLHFHALFHIPDGTMIGELAEHKDYSFSMHKRIVTQQNTYFNERFGRTDFESIGSNKDLMREIAYICKYLEKTEEKIVYSKGLYQYFITDIKDQDVVCTIGQEDKKLLLYDDFVCIHDGKPLGTVSPDIIALLRKSN